MEKEEIITAISQIRKEIGHENLTPDITDVIFDEEKSRAPHHSIRPSREIFSDR